MAFTTLKFALFLCAAAAGYFVLPKRARWVWLLLASGYFYARAGTRYVGYLLGSAALCWGYGLYAARLRRVGKERGLKGAAAVVIVLHIGALLVLRGPGLSFFAFMAIGYCADVCRGTAGPERNPLRIALFLGYFPHLMQGPIDRWGDAAPQLFAGHGFDFERVRRGLYRMLWGMFEKLVVADRILAAVMTIIGDVETYQGAYAAVGMLFYTVQLYADFTGGIDVTIGLAQALGITVKENFERPYFSKSLKEYWRRWHISMCSWFRDYLFYPISTSKAMQGFTKLARKRLGDKVGRRLPVYLSSFVVWFSTGLWHGASWNFIVWGLLNYAVLMFSEELEPLYERVHRRFAVRGKLWYCIFQVGRTFLLICVLNIFDCYAYLGETVQAIGSVFTVHNWSVLWDGSLLALGLSALDYGILTGGCALMLGVSLIQRRGSVRERIHEKPYWVRFALWYSLFLAVLLMGAYGVGYDASQFIYNRF